MISVGDMSSSRSLTLLSSTSTPVPPLDATSESAVERPPPPRSFIPRILARLETISRSESRRSFFMKGSGTWTEERSLPASSLRFFEAKVAPLIPSLPVLPPIKDEDVPGCLRLPEDEVPLLPQPHAGHVHQAVPLEASRRTLSPPPRSGRPRSCHSRLSP